MLGGGWMGGIALVQAFAYAVRIPFDGNLILSIVAAIIGGACADILVKKKADLFRD